ncbi:hypothetical protein PYV02_05985 [Leifsonia sp. H3M29-4]|uniref:hypothetical protein n=1 Tax=Salinibacterium metalliresistens TaxID=3031321 RepID=UPI0023DAEB9C|nr:hypothetical protein [Salinibacterium metalliresistens]MDF1478632.1 hypothetical protein [Salinibacterium metalliresistens]
MKIIGFIAALVFFLVGIYVLGLAFQVVGYETVVFIGGILLISIGVAIPMHLMKRIDA